MKLTLTNKTDNLVLHTGLKSVTSVILPVTDAELVNKLDTVLNYQLTCVSTGGVGGGGLGA